MICRVIHQRSGVVLFGHRTVKLRVIPHIKIDLKGAILLTDVVKNSVLNFNNKMVLFVKLQQH